MARAVRERGHVGERFPADYICEALDQTRGWFYSLLAVSVLLYGEASYRTCLCLGLILDPEGQKMSKSKGNVVVPWDVLTEHGADAFRWYYFTSKQPWDGYRFSLETVGESVRQFLKPLWNTYAFYVQYANLADDLSDAAPETDLDRWILSRLSATTERVIERMEDYDTTFAGRAIAEFVDDLSNWYVRLSRRRFWRGDAGGLRDPARVPARRVEAAGSAHAVRDRRDLRQPRRIRAVRPPLRLPGAGRARRGARVAACRSCATRSSSDGRRAAHAKMKMRQPLREAVVVAAERERRPSRTWRASSRTS